MRMLLKLIYLAVLLVAMLHCNSICGVHSTILSPSVSSSLSSWRNSNPFYTSFIKPLTATTSAAATAVPAAGQKTNEKLMNGKKKPIRFGNPFKLVKRDNTAAATAALTAGALNPFAVSDPYSLLLNYGLGGLGGGVVGPLYGGGGLIGGPVGAVVVAEPEFIGGGGMGKRGKGRKGGKGKGRRKNKYMEGDDDEFDGRSSGGRGRGRKQQRNRNGNKSNMQQRKYGNSNYGGGNLIRNVNNNVPGNYYYESAGSNYPWAENQNNNYNNYNTRARNGGSRSSNGNRGYNDRKKKKQKQQNKNKNDNNYEYDPYDVDLYAKYLNKNNQNTPNKKAGSSPNQGNNYYRKLSAAAAQASSNHQHNQHYNNQRHQNDAAGRQQFAAANRSPSPSPSPLPLNNNYQRHF